MIILLLAAAADAAADPVQPDEVVITASRIPGTKDETAASVDVIDQQTLARLDVPLVYDVLRLVPSTSVAASGPAGTFTQVRIRGAEANHTLLFIDGIEANDLSFGDEPRFELLNADLASRVEVVRGPQSALWGSQAIGGVVAVTGATAETNSYHASAEAGSFGFARAMTSGSLVDGDLHLSGAVGWQRATGIDVSGTGGDRDGYHNLSARALASWTLSPDVTLGLNGFSLNGYSQFDGNDPVTFAPSQDLSTRFGMAAGRAWAAFGSGNQGLSGSLAASLFDTRNHNLFKGEETSSASGTRRTVSADARYGFATGTVKHEFVAAANYENESFSTFDKVFGINSRDQRRIHEALTGEWKADVRGLTADVALRHDFFSRFNDATTLRASLIAPIGSGFSVAGSYGEGISPPTFTELYGFFPGSFIGNPKLKPETSRGYEASVRYHHGPLAASLTGYRQRLHDEIVGNADFTTSLNAPGISHRSGVEVEATWSLAEALRVSANYSYLDATQPNDAGQQIREIRRPKHSGAIAIDGSVHRFSYGGSLAYVGTRTDTDFNVFPTTTVGLRAYWLAGARVAYALGDRVQLFVRGSNLLNQHYQDVLGDHVEGRGVYAGLTLASAGHKR
ncbi:MAG TPA: TonB-dependent receptor [Sphingomicrobium sp.]|nr:TonB-dependent receptor [Sphingomicrobium sp.]